jgi:hypothetical protein
VIHWVSKKKENDKKIKRNPDRQTHTPHAHGRVHVVTISSCLMKRVVTVFLIAAEQRNGGSIAGNAV